MFKGRREYRQVVNMPQMAMGGLSESWLMKEIGDCHWQMLCADLGLKSNEIFDEFGNRLYATFIRIKFESHNSLKDYQENDILKIMGETQRLGNSLYFGKIDVLCNKKRINCSLATTFSTRENDTDNTKLTKGVPAASDNDEIIKVSDLPEHILDIIRLRKASITTVNVSDHTFELTDNVVFTEKYEINPYTDINGVGLLYFAAYPLINDICELTYFNKNELVGANWALNSSTMSRDIFYFANCNINEAICYRLNSLTRIGSDHMALQSSLYRESDNTLMAKIFTIKQFRN
ncbi:hypothetical protein KI809_03745 [Geobacter pelophilus]|uniref:Biosynthetic protein, Pnap_2097 family n=1 Tax=Geoanaerobacter pelophilus TaxID=60036 RepID=A0AAW4KXQ1_9BACT|nr:Pnap_2097 family protein [Geoanaerobacter pelophilus]MBT0663406.1 hypothetical protein [Geoanaerobacter pelophilus]